MRCRLLLACALGACATDDIATAQQSITNGTPATGDPAVIALVDADARVVCTASVIGTHTAITASHCIAGRDPRTLRAVFGMTIGTGTVIAISGGRTHPMFDGSTLANDVAMVTLREEAPVAPLALDTRTLDASLVGTTFRVVGWGTTAGGAGDLGEKREGVARISAVSASELTAVPDPSQPCRGDSGGPALLSPTAVAAVVSRGDLPCKDHATYARIDVARAILVDPYLADTAPGTAHTGDACLYEGHCAEGPCLQAKDDPLLAFCSAACSRDSDCPAAMECAADRCRYPEPSPGALGSTCAVAAECTSNTCHAGVCTLDCFYDADVCPAGFECEGDMATRYCYASDDGGCGGCTSGSSPPLWLALLWLVTTARSCRSRAARSS